MTDWSPEDERFSTEPFFATWLEGDDEILYRNGHDFYEFEEEEACLFELIVNSLTVLSRQVSREAASKWIHDSFLSPTHFLETDDATLAELGLDDRNALYYSLIPSIARMVGMGYFSSHPRLNTCIKMAEYLKSLFIGRHDECFYIVLLDKRGYLIKPVLITKGTTDTIIFTMGDVITTAMQYDTQGLVFCHNHPMGTLKPSDDDIACTLYALSALKSIDIPLLDHIIIADNSAYSFREDNIFPVKLWVDQAPSCKLIRNWLNKGEVLS